MTASKQKSWDHFTKAQRKNIDTWRKQLQVGCAASTASHKADDRISLLISTIFTQALEIFTFYVFKIVRHFQFLQSDEICESIFKSALCEGCELGSCYNVLT